MFYTYMYIKFGIFQTVDIFDAIFKDYETLFI